MIFSSQDEWRESENHRRSGAPGAQKISWIKKNRNRESKNGRKLDSEAKFDLMPGERPAVKQKRAETEAVRESLGIESRSCLEACVVS